MLEYIDERLKTRELTPARALEIADLVYYLEQPAWQDKIYEQPAGDGEEVESPGWVIEGLAMVPHEVAQRFCILKYLTRINMTNTLPKKERDAVEANVMARFLKVPAIETAVADFLWDYEQNNQVRVRKQMWKGLGYTALKIDRFADEYLQDILAS